MLLLGLGGPKFLHFCSWCECCDNDKGNLHKPLIEWSPDIDDEDDFGHGYILRSSERIQQLFSEMPTDVEARKQ